MTETKIDISIIIVNYRVKEYISLLIDSIKKAKNDLEIEIFIVDNNSDDGSIEYLSRIHDNITYIRNDTNEGFGKANNQGIKEASGTYTLLINPDTVIEEESLWKLKTFLDSHSKCGAAGFKMINSIGNFAKESKRSVPDLKSGIFRALALDVLFPKSKLFGKRYLGWIPEEQIASVPVISGAGMFWRTDVLKALDGFDEDFFMYGEDDDLCYRLQETTYDIQYFPEAKLIHFKGESERPLNVKSLKKVNKGLIQFFEKHYKGKYNSISCWLISIAFYVRLMIIYLKTLVLPEKPFIQEKVKEVILIGDYNPEILASQLNRESDSFKALSKVLDYDKMRNELNALANSSNNKVMVIFDVSSISYERALKLMEDLKSKKLSFHFLLKSEKMIVGKSSVIKL